MRIPGVALTAALPIFWAVVGVQGVANGAVVPHRERDAPKFLFPRHAKGQLGRRQFRSNSTVSSTIPVVETDDPLPNNNNQEPPESDPPTATATATGGGGAGNLISDILSSFANEPLLGSRPDDSSTEEVISTTELPDPTSTPVSSTPPRTTEPSLSLTVPAIPSASLPSISRPVISTPAPSSTPPPVSRPASSSRDILDDDQSSSAVVIPPIVSRSPVSSIPFSSVPDTVPTDTASPTVVLPTNEASSLIEEPSDSIPASEPTGLPTGGISSDGPTEPTGGLPSSEPTAIPTGGASSEGPSEPTGGVSSEPTGVPTGGASSEGPSEPTGGVPSSEPTAGPTGSEPTGAPTGSEPPAPTGSEPPVSSVGAGPSEPPSSAAPPASVTGGGAAQSAAPTSSDAPWFPQDPVTAGPPPATPTGADSAEDPIESDIPASLPKFMTPFDGVPDADSDSVLIRLGFRYQLNYPWVVAHAESSAQIFEYIPKGLNFGLDIQVAKAYSLKPFDARSTSGYIATLVLAYIPKDKFDKLDQDRLLPTSDFNNNPVPHIKMLLDLLDPSIPLLASEEDLNGNAGNAGGPGSKDINSDTGTDNGGAIGRQAGNSNRNLVSVVGGSMAAAIVYAGAMFFVARRYRRRRAAARHNRADSISRSSSPGSDPTGALMSSRADAPAFMTGAGGYGATTLANKRGSDSSGGRASAKTANISGPVMNQNTLGWS